jgi:hypothetical protein
MAESDSTPAAPARGADAADSEWILADVPTVEKGWWGLTDSARAVLESTKPAAGESEPAEAIIESEAPQSQSEPVDKDEAQAESEAEHKAEAADEPQAEPEAEPEPHPTPVPTAAGSAKNDRKGKATTRKKLPVSGGTTPEAPAQSKKAIEEQAKAAAAKDAAKKPLKNRKKKR